MCVGKSRPTLNMFRSRHSFMKAKRSNGSKLMQRRAMFSKGKQCTVMQNRCLKTGTAWFWRTSVLVYLYFHLVHITELNLFRTLSSMACGFEWLGKACILLTAYLRPSAQVCFHVHLLVAFVFVVNGIEWDLVWHCNGWYCKSSSFVGLPQRPCMLVEMLIVVEMTTIAAANYPGRKGHLEASSKKTMIMKSISHRPGCGVRKTMISLMLSSIVSGEHFFTQGSIEKQYIEN